MKPRHYRLMAIGGGVSLLVIAGLLVLNAFRSNLVYFFSPTEMLAGTAPVNKMVRVGGMVEKGSVRKGADGLTVDFIITDMNKRIDVRYKGILPDLFREGQGVVAQGQLDDSKRFIASEVLAKHDEKYMPPEAAAAMKGATFQKP